jgi:hypothetical protein
LVGGLGVILNSYNLEETMAQFNVIARPIMSGDPIDPIAEAGRLAEQEGAATVVMLRRDNDRAHTPLDVTLNLSQQTGLLPLNVPGLDRSQLPTFLYCWQPETSLMTAAGG